MNSLSASELYSSSEEEPPVHRRRLEPRQRCLSILSIPESVLSDIVAEIPRRYHLSLFKELRSLRADTLPQPLSILKSLVFMSLYEYVSKPSLSGF